MKGPGKVVPTRAVDEAREAAKRLFDRIHATAEPSPKAPRARKAAKGGKPVPETG